MFKSKWTRFDIMKHIDTYYPEISYKIMGMNKHSKLQIGRFAHSDYGRLFVHKIYIKREGVTKIIFSTEKIAKTSAGRDNPMKSNKAFMNEWIKKDLKKLSV
jgi:hypothetical protein